MRLRLLSETRQHPEKLAKAQEILEHVQLVDTVYWGLETNLKEFML